MKFDLRKRLSFYQTQSVVPNQSNRIDWIGPKIKINSAIRLRYIAIEIIVYNKARQDLVLRRKRVLITDGSSGNAESGRTVEVQGSAVVKQPKSP